MGALFLKMFKVKNLIAKGLALGTAGHALGVAFGIEVGVLLPVNSGINMDLL